METAEQLLAHVRDHAVFAGYDVSTEKGDALSFATHPTQFKFAFRAYRGGVLFSAFFEAKENASLGTTGFAEFVNELNFNATVEPKSLCAEFWFAGPYESGAFSRLFDAWRTEMSLCVERYKEAGQKFMK
jgi:hypothetical protein